MSLIYGRNGTGKSTIADVLRCVGVRDDEVLKLRFEIREDGTNASRQFAEMSFSPVDGGSETVVTYDCGAWTGSPAPYRIRVFDTTFIDANVFTGIRHEHKNRQALTQLILGERAVSAEQALKAAQEERAGLIETLRASEASLVKRVAAAGLSVELHELMRPPSSTKETAEIAASELESKIGALRKVAQHTATVIALSDLQTAIAQCSTLACVEKMVAAGRRARPIPDAGAIEYIRHHVPGLASDESGAALHWLRTGWQRVSAPAANQDCPFCAQSLAPAAELLTAYASLFDESVADYLQSATSDLDAADDSAQAVLAEIERLAATVNANTKVAGALRPFLADVDSAAVDLLITHGVTLLDAAQASRRESESVLKAVGEARQIVDANPSEDWTAMATSLEACETADRDLRNALAAYEATRSTVQALIEKTRGSATADTGAALQGLEAELSDQRLDQKRIEWNADLEAHAVFLHRLDELKGEIPVLKGAVLSEQEAFVSQYFDRVNELLGDLTVNDFHVAYEKNKAGTDPVYGIGLVYRGQRVDGARVPFTLSDGDRRSLALAIFIATLDHDTDKGNCIVVLDDPVTSLDEDRRRETVRQLVRLIKEVRQVILLSHYKSFLAQTYRRLRGVQTVCLECVRTGSASALEPLSESNLASTEYDRLLEQMQSFVDGNPCSATARNMLGDTRTVVETEIRRRYRAYLSDFDAFTLGSMLDHLADKGAVGGEILDELRYLNSEVSEVHHEVDDDYDPSDVRTVARRALRLLFETMVASPDGAAA